MMEIGNCTEGEIVLTINGQDYSLVVGAKLHYTGIPHSFSNVARGIYRIITPNTPTTF
ncbi:hypothetical protein OIU92_29215 [Escherichia coli]|nr:hypothetical protein [Escherichia coli]